MPSAPRSPSGRATMTDQPLRSGSRIGILGGGQLGRMTALAAAELGYRVHIFCPESEAPAIQVADAARVANYADRAALDAFAGAGDVVTFEFANATYESAAPLDTRAPVRPAQRRCPCADALKDALVTPLDMVPSEVKESLAPIIGRYLVERPTGS